MKEKAGFSFSRFQEISTKIFHTLLRFCIPDYSLVGHLKRLALQRARLLVTTTSMLYDAFL